MGSSYFVYLEVKINNKWHCASPIMPNFEYDFSEHVYTGKSENKLSPIYQNGSRSYFSETMQKLRDIGHSVEIKTLSGSLYNHWKHEDEDEDTSVKNDFFDNSDYYNPVVVDYKTFKSYIKPDVFDRHGLVHKDDWVAYENGDLEEIYAATPENLKGIGTEGKKAYVYKEWDEPTGWLFHFKDIKKVADAVIYIFAELNYAYCDDFDYRLVIFER